MQSVYRLLNLSSPLPEGTHGHMKCQFDNQLRSQDTVMMNLFKRAYPRWTYDPYAPIPLPWVKSELSEEIEDADMD
jgi:pre-rRNA-processing protein TSR1